MPCYNETIMNSFHFIAQTTQYNRNSVTSTTDAAIANTLVIFYEILLLTFIISVFVYVFVAICTMQIFKKAGVKPWIAWVPFYNNWKLLEIGGQPGFWAVVGIIPFVNIVTTIFIYIAMYHIGKKLGKTDAFVVWGILFPYVWYPWLAFDKSVWNDAGSIAPSLHKA